MSAREAISRMLLSYSIYKCLWNPQSHQTKQMNHYSTWVCLYVDRVALPIYLCTNTKYSRSGSERAAGANEVVFLSIDVRGGRLHTIREYSCYVFAYHCKLAVRLVRYVRRIRSPEDLVCGQRVGGSLGRKGRGAASSTTKSTFVAVVYIWRAVQRYTPDMML